MKRITCFITALSSGGAEHQITMLSGYLAERGYLVSLVTFADEDDHYVVDKRVERVTLNCDGKKWKKFWAIFRYFLTIKTDCVISFGARENFLCLLPLLFRHNIKVLAGERCATYNKLDWYKRFNYRFLYGRANYIVPNSYTQKEDLSIRLPRYSGKIRVITNFTDVTEYCATPQPHNEPLRIGIFCRFAEQKNYRRFAYAVKLLKEQTNRLFEVHWFGNMHHGKDLIAQYVELNGLICKLHIEDCFFLHDHTRQVSVMLKGFDALCLPSLTEGFSNSISEYICCGRPVLASDVADNKVMIKDGENGFLFNPESIESIANSFKRFFALSPEKLDEMGIKSRELAESLFSKNRFVESYIKLVES